MSDLPAAITGVGAVTPLGVGADTLHERWVAGECGLEDGVGLCRDFDPHALLTRKQAHRTERFVQLGIAACREAVQQAWGDDLPYPPERIGCILGVSFGGTRMLFDQYDAMNESGIGAVSPLTVPVIMPNATAAMLAMNHGFRGETRSVASACASAAQAIGEGLRAIRSGEADAVIVGGAEAACTEFIMAAFRNAGALSRTGICRPFDRRRDGFVIAEGAGLLVLENAEKAKARGGDVLGYVSGYASTTDGEHLTAPSETGKTCAIAIRNALASAGRTTDEVDYVNAHGTSTPANDLAETAALKAALGDRAYEVPIAAPKSAVGHSIGAAGGVEAITALMALRDRVAAPTVGLEEVDERLDLQYVPDSAVPIALRDGEDRLVGLSNSFAFGGHNAVVVLEA